MSEYQKIVETRFQRLAKRFDDIGAIETKPISYNQISIHLENRELKSDWVVMSHEQAELLADMMENMKDETQLTVYEGML